MPSREITELKDAIRATHGCESLHVESVPVKEVFEDHTNGKEPLKFSILSVISSRNAPTLGATGTAIKERRWRYSKSRKSIRREVPSKSQSEAKHDQMSIEENRAP